MKTINFFPIYFGLILIMIFGCIDDSDNKKVKELESILVQSEVLSGEMDLQKIINSRSHAIDLFENIENKELLIPETYKVIGVLYFINANSDKALITLGKYIDTFPNDGEALFYKGIILKQKNMDYCDYIKRSKELDFERYMELMFTWNLNPKDTCL